MTQINQLDAPATDQASIGKTGPKSRKRRMAREPKASDPASNDGTTRDVKTPKPAKSKEPRGSSKIASVIALLEREEGATLAEMVEATGWLPHTTRAALTGLKKKGHAITKDKRGDVTCYRIAKAN